MIKFIIDSYCNTLKYCWWQHHICISCQFNKFLFVECRLCYRSKTI